MVKKLGIPQLVKRFCEFLRILMFIAISIYEARIAQQNVYNINILYIFQQFWQLYEFTRQRTGMNTAMCQGIQNISML